MNYAKIYPMDNLLGLIERKETGIKIIKVLIADDHPLMCDSLKSHLENEENIEVIATADNGEEAVKLALKLVPDVVIMDISMPILNGIEATRQIKSMNPKIKVLVLTVHADSEHILKIFEAGAEGYISKKISGSKFPNAIRSIIDGCSVLSEEVMGELIKHALRLPSLTVDSNPVPILTTRELVIFKLVALGKSNKQIAEELKLNIRTVKGYVSNIFLKLNANCRTEAVMAGIKAGLLSIQNKL